jgi:hypothetical protein
MIRKIIDYFVFLNRKKSATIFAIFEVIGRPDDSG